MFVLGADRALLHKLSEAGAERAAKLNWSQSAEPLLALVEEWFPERLTLPKKPTRRVIQIRKDRKAVVPAE